MTYGSNEYWEARRAELSRAKRRREMARVLDAAINTLMALMLISAVLGICYLAGRETRGRAAYLEGRWGVDHATAIAYAKEVR